MHARVCRVFLGGAQGDLIVSGFGDIGWLFVVEGAMASGIVSKKAGTLTAMAILEYVLISFSVVFGSDVPTSARVDRVIPRVRKIAHRMFKRGSFGDFHIIRTFML
jgi:hypothetical protein